MARDRKYKTKNTNYVPGNDIRDIVKTVKQGKYRTGSHKDEERQKGLIPSAHDKVKKIKDELLGKDPNIFKPYKSNKAQH